MTFENFKNKYINQVVGDQSLAGVDPYTDKALINRYLTELYQIQPEYWGEVEEYWTKPNPALLAKFEPLPIVEVEEGDIVFITSEAGAWHIGLGTGACNSSQVEILEQDGETGSGDGVDGDAIRARYIPKSQIVGVFRPKELMTTPVVIPVVEEPKDHKFAHSPVKVPLHRVEFRIVTQVPYYRYMSFAQAGKDPSGKLHPGKYYMTSQHGGMAKVDQGEGTESYWIDPAANTLVKKTSPRKDTRGNFTWFIEPVKYKADSGYMKNHTEGEVFSWTDKPNAKIKYNQPVWVAGTCVDGESLYAIPANPRPDGSFTNMEDYGILLSYLSPVQLEYEPEDLISDVNPPEAEILVPRPVSIKDNFTLVKAHGQKFIDGILKK